MSDAYSPAPVVESAADDFLEAAGRGATSPEEAELWCLALGAAIFTR